MLEHAASRGLRPARRAAGRQSRRGGTGGRCTRCRSRSDTFGSSGIAPIEMLFNRGPYPVGGGSSVVDATGWDIGEGFETITVPSMRMVVDLVGLRRVALEPPHRHERPRVPPELRRPDRDVAAAELTPWAFTRSAVDAATTHTLTLVPAD